MTGTNRSLKSVLRFCRHICFIAVLSLVGGTSSLLHGQAGSQCEPSTLVAKQKRTEMKHRKSASKGTDVTQTAVSEILDWDTPDDISDKETKDSNAPIDAFEDQVFEVEGDLWRVALEANDCDYHLELSAPGGDEKALRIIAEIPDDAGYSTARKNLLDALEKSDRDKLEGSGSVKLQKPVRLRLTGYGFFDAFHYTSKYNPAKLGKCKFTKAQKLKRGNGHGTCAVGTLWELHPAWRLQAVGTE